MREKKNPLLSDFVLKAKRVYIFIFIFIFILFFKKNEVECR